jgi:hypothetical protein
MGAAGQSADGQTTMYAPNSFGECPASITTSSPHCDGAARLFCEVDTRVRQRVLHPSRNSTRPKIGHLDPQVVAQEDVVRFEI